jgi:peroxin-7
LSASGDRSARIWDIRTGRSVSAATLHGGEVLSCDWDKYSDRFVTASVDQTLRIWDVRSLNSPLQILVGHNLAIRRVKYSPFSSEVLASASYDMTVRVWNLSSPESPIIHTHHTEFAVGVDFSLFDPS